MGRFLGLGGAAAVSSAALTPLAAAPSGQGSGTANGPGGLSQLFMARPGRRRRHSSSDPTGGNVDHGRIEPGETYEMADLKGAGCIRHIWIVASRVESDHLRKLVFRAYWDGQSNPSIESPLGDFFGVGHARVSNYWSLPLNIVTGGEAQAINQAGFNCFFPMPFAKGARLTIENQGSEEVGAILHYVDYEEYDALPDDALRFHAQWRRQNPTEATVDLGDRSNVWDILWKRLNRDLSKNYLILEATGRGHHVGCNLSVDHIDPMPGEGWYGEGDDSFWIDGEEQPSMTGSGTEDYFCAAMTYPGGQHSTPYHGLSYAGGPTKGPGRFSGKWTMYRFHIEDPVMFNKSIKFSIEHGHDNVHANDYSSVAYWYQTLPHKPFPPLVPVKERLPIPDRESRRRYYDKI